MVNLSNQFQIVVDAVYCDSLYGNKIFSVFEFKYLLDGKDDERILFQELDDISLRDWRLEYGE